MTGSLGRPGLGLALVVMLFGSRGAFALDPSLDVSQYAHTAWRIRDGFTQGEITAIAQTPDGYLWLGTEFGLLRFDGVRTLAWHPPGEQLPANHIMALLIARDGTLWIGTAKGVASWRDGKLTQYPELAGHWVFGFVQDRDGTVWARTALPGKLCAIQSGKVQCQGEGHFGSGITAAYEDHVGNLWVSASNGLWRWKPGPPEHYSFPPHTTEANDLIEDASGALLLATNDGVKRLAGGRIESHPPPGLDAEARPARFLRSSDGSLWVGTFHGLVHSHAGKTDVFGVREGLSGDVIQRLFEDRERNIWVSTSGGLDRFRGYSFPTVSAKQGLSSSSVWAVQATPDGSTWIASSDGLNRWRNGHVTFHGKQTGSPRSLGGGLTSSAAAPALETVARSLGADDRGRLWAATVEEVLYVERDRFVRVPGLPGGNVWAIAPDRHGTTWVSVGYKGLFQRTAGGVVREFPWTTFGKSIGANALLPDPSRGGLWLGFHDGGVTYLEDGRVRAAYGAADGLGTGRVSDLRLDEQGTLWAATEGGLSRIRDGHVLTVTARNGLPCDRVYWSIEDDDGFVWLYMTCGLVRISRSELDAWASDPRGTLQATVFDASDGVRTVASLGGYGPPVTKASDGRIWFASPDGATVIDPRRLPHNDLQPPVHIEQITADGKVHEVPAGGARIRLPPRVRDLALDYTALSLVAPEKVRFRVKLEGQDEEWRELVNARHVQYTNLPPKDYRFVVKASNDSGVWNEEGAFLDFTIAPAFDQTTWFRALCVAAALALLFAAYRLRVAALERRHRLLEEHHRVLEQHHRLVERHEAEMTALNERLMKAQEDERTRIAGELHDGVLQQLTSLALNLGSVKYQVPPGSPAKSEIAGVQKDLIQIGTEIRQLSHELHPAVLQEAGLPQALSTYCGEFSKTRGVPVSCEADPGVKELSPGTALALYRIAQEALGNVAKHAKATQVRVRLARAGGVVRLTVSDDGVGFVPGRAGDAGGVGLVNMRERVRQLGGTLLLESEPGRGSTIRAEVPMPSHEDVAQV